MSRSADATNRAAPWLHLVLLLVLVALIEAGQRVLGGSGPLTLPLLARDVYAWLPALAGIGISIAGPRNNVTRDGLLIALASLLLMVSLDLAIGSRVATDFSSALFPDASVSPMARASRVAPPSWIHTVAAWLQGDLAGVDLVRDAYGLEDGRLRAVDALASVGFLLTVFASVGFVIAAMSWVRAHVVFRRATDSRGVHIVLGWLVAPTVVDLLNQFSRAQQFRVLFRGAVIWRPVVPAIAGVLLGLLAWWYTARYRESEDA